MSTNTTLISSAIAVVTLAGLSITVAANAQSSRYGNVYDYESGRNCGQACAAPAPQARYGHTTTHTVAPAPVYVDCSVTGTCAPQPTTVYTQPAPVQYQATTTYAAPSYTQAPVSCPAGTTAQPDGTCLQSSASSYSSSSTYTAPTTSYGSGSSYSTTTTAPANCPAGTTAQSDGTCMQGSSYSSTTSSYGSDTSYSAPTTSYGSGSSYSSTSAAPANCPAGTTAQSDGTCMQGGSSATYSGSTVELYTGDATTSSSSTSSYGYTSDGGYAATDYLPIRK